MAQPRNIRLVVAGDATALRDLYIEDGSRTLRRLLEMLPQQVETLDAPLDPVLLDRPVSCLNLVILDGAEAPGGATRHALPAGPAAAAAAPGPPRPAPQPASALPASPAARLSEGQAVALAYRDRVTKLASFLRARLSLLVLCEKLIAADLCRSLLAETWIPDPKGGADIRPEPVYLELPPERAADALAGGSRLDELRQKISELKPTQVLVIRHLDLMGGGERTPGREARELTELIYSALDRTVLAFADPSLPIPDVIAARFAVREEVQGLPREVTDPDGKRRPIESVLVSADEAAHFTGFATADLYKHIAGLNPARLRQAVTYTLQLAADAGHSRDRPAPLELLVQGLRAFKAQTGEQFNVPDVRFEDIGGYDEVKATLEQAIRLLSGAGRLPDEKLRTELVPRGFLFHGPPGTGKTLFAKAIANRLNATIRVVSGPEVTDMYVGESERKVRVLFAEARRSAPAVIVFDEFDSIAASRSGRDDGGSRAGNALVAQILTEMDGFRPDVPLLVVGTTNRLGLIDKALLRPSRFQPIAIGLPDLAARRRIAEIHAGHFRIDAPAALLDLVAEATEGLNGDELRAVFRDAAVGLYCEGIAADAGRLGYLVGRVRTRLDAQTLLDAESAPPPPPGERRRPGPGHAPMPPRPPQAAASSDIPPQAAASSDIPPQAAATPEIPPDAAGSRETAPP